MANDHAAVLDENLLVTGMNMGMDAGMGAGMGMDAGMGGMGGMDDHMSSAERARLDQEAAYLEDQNRIRNTAAQGTVGTYEHTLNIYIY